MTRTTTPWTFRFFGLDHREAYRKAETELREAGFSVGPRQRGAPTGILFGDYKISKWRNLRAADRETLHGTIDIEGYYAVVQFGAMPIEIDDALHALNDKLIAAEMSHGDRIEEDMKNLPG